MKSNRITSAEHSGNTLVVGIPKRSLKFRCWDVFNQRMVNDPYLFGPKPDYLDNPEPYRFYETWNDVEDGIWRLCYVVQFTGFKDVKGNEIYEGDILSLWYSRDTTGKDVVRFNHTVTWEDANGFSGWNIPFLESAEIIGNVFTHPELAE